MTFLDISPFGLSSPSQSLSFRCARHYYYYCYCNTKNGVYPSPLLSTYWDTTKLLLGGTASQVATNLVQPLSMQLQERREIQS